MMVSNPISVVARGVKVEVEETQPPRSRKVSKDSLSYHYHSLLRLSPSLLLRSITLLDDPLKTEAPILTVDR